MGELQELRQIFGDPAAHCTVAKVRRALHRIDPVMGRVRLGKRSRSKATGTAKSSLWFPIFVIRPSGDCVDRLHRQMLGEIAEQQQLVPQHRDYLRQERESHFPNTGPGLLPTA